MKYNRGKVLMTRVVITLNRMVREGQQKWWTGTRTWQRGNEPCGEIWGKSILGRGNSKNKGSEAGSVHGIFEKQRGSCSWVSREDKIGEAPFLLLTAWSQPPSFLTRIIAVAFYHSLDFSCSHNLFSAQQPEWSFKNHRSHHVPMIESPSQGIKSIILASKVYSWRIKGRWRGWQSVKGPTSPRLSLEYDSNASSCGFLWDYRFHPSVTCSLSGFLSQMCWKSSEKMVEGCVQVPGQLLMGNSGCTSLTGNIWMGAIYLTDFKKNK